MFLSSVQCLRAWSPNPAWELIPTLPRPALDPLLNLPTLGLVSSSLSSPVLTRAAERDLMGHMSEGLEQTLACDTSSH